MTTSDTRDVEATVAEVRLLSLAPPRVSFFRPREPLFATDFSLTDRIARASPPSTPTRQVIKCADAGAEMVRITVQGMQEAKACVEIKKTLLERGYDAPATFTWPRWP